MEKDKIASETTGLKVKNPAERLWETLASIKLAIVVFGLIAVSSIVGTIIEQQAPAEKNLEVLSRLVGQDLAPAFYRVLDALGFTNMYRSWWFLTLLGLFALNLLVCSLERFPGIWKITKTPVRPLPKASFNAMAIKSELVLKDSPGEVREKVLSAVQGAGFSHPLEAAEDDGSYQFYAQRFARSRLGVYITHFSILLILLGAVIGARLGFKGFIYVPEGDSLSFFISDVYLSDQGYNQRNGLLQMLDSVNGDVSRLSETLKMPLSALKPEMKKLGVYPLDFSVRCDQFDVQYYEPSDMPKAYRSLLTIIDGGREVMKKWVEVNDPLTYKGVTFYQSSYRLLDDYQRAVVILGAADREGRSEVLRVKPGEPFKLPDGRGAKVTELNPALQLDEMGRPFTYSKMMVNPAVKVEFPGGVSQWLVQRRPATWLLPDGGSLRLIDIWGIQATGLQVRKDPGVWVVYLGCIVLSLGLFIAFFLSHKKLWVRVSPEKQGSRVQIAGYAHKGRHSLETKIEKIKATLKEGGS